MGGFEDENIHLVHPRASEREAAANEFDLDRKLNIYPFPHEPRYGLDATRFYVQNVLRRNVIFDSLESTVIPYFPLSRKRLCIMRALGHPTKLKRDYRTNQVGETILLVVFHFSSPIATKMSRSVHLPTRIHKSKKTGACPRHAPSGWW
jgi:hypothetical protein